MRGRRIQPLTCLREVTNLSIVVITDYRYGDVVAHVGANPAMSAGFDWTVLVLVIVAVVAAAIALVWAFRRRLPATNRRAPFVSATLTIATAWAGLAILFAIIALILPFQSNAHAVMPVAVNWPLPYTEPPTNVDTSTMVSMSLDRVNVGGAGLPFAAKMLWGVGAALGSLAHAAVAGLIALVCFHLLSGNTFVHRITRAAVWTAVIVVVAGFGAQMFQGAGGQMAFAAVLVDLPAEYTDLPYSVGGTLDYAPIGLALVILSFATLFQYGTRLQRDTEGLV